MKLSPLAGALALAFVLPGCSALDALHTATVADDLRDSGVVDGTPAAPEDVALRTGTASYTGLGVVGATDGTLNNATAWLGDAAMTVDFSGGTVTGSVDMYRGKGGLDSSDPDAFFDQIDADFLLSMNDASGLVTLNGTVSGGGVVLNATSGTLSTGGTTAQVTGGTVSGEFTGSAANGIRSTGSSVTGTLNGSPADAIELYFAVAE